MASTVSILRTTPKRCNVNFMKKGNEHQSRYIPPAGDNQKPIALTANLQIDGETLGRTVEEHIAQDHELPTRQTPRTAWRIPTLTDGIPVWSMISST